MRVGRARTVAASWVADHADRIAGFRGAFFSGSTVSLAADAQLPATSDVDVVVVIADDEPPLKPGKFRYRDVLLEVSYLSLDRLRSAEQVLGAYHLAGSFRTDTVISDPTGQLRRLNAEVSRHFAEPTWVLRRCADAQHRIESHLRGIGPSAPFHDQVTGWLFATGVTTHVVLVAALRNPTVRLRYLAARNVLAEYGRDEVYAELLDLLGVANLAPERAAEHLDNLTATFDAAAAAARTPYFFSGDITPAARVIAIDGSQRLVERGDHREAMFWIVATYARCLKILAADAPPLARAHAPALADAVADLGIVSPADIARRSAELLAYLPRLWATAEAIAARGHTDRAADPGPTRTGPCEHKG